MRAGIFYTGIAAAFVLAMGTIGRMDYNDQSIAQAHTCQMVAEGNWPEAVARGYDCGGEE